MKEKILLGILALFVSSIAYLTFSDFKVNPEVHKSGVVIDKFTGTESHHHKHSTSYTDEMYLVVKYDDGHIDRENVVADTYYKFNVGNRIGFMKSLPETGWHIALSLFFIAGWGSIILLIAAYLLGLLLD